MPENPNNQRNKPLRGGGQFKMLTIWMMVIGLIVILLYTTSQQKYVETKTLTINQVVEAARQESSPVKSGVLRPEPSNGYMWHEITGTWEEAGQDPQQFRATGQLTENNLAALQATNLFKEEAPNHLWSSVLGFLPFLLIFALIYIFFVRQIRQAGRGAMSFGKSRARMLTRDREKITFKDVAGCDEAKEEVAEIVEFLKDPKKFQRIGGRIPKGALLVGPPGTGKTLLARAVAGEADVPFFSISGSDFVEMFVGVGAARVRDMFEQGRKNAPCIIFIDEIDAVGRQRGAGLGGGNDEREQTLNSLLVEMDGFDGHEGVIIMAATNRPDVLDNALMRPGRFDRQIVIDLPDLTGREEILRVHAKKIKLSSSVNLAEIARGTPGFSGADLANLLNESALLAARRNKSEVDRLDIDDARDKIAYGRERRKLMDDEDKRITAYHEAGHALVQALLDDRKLKLHKVTIIPRGRALGLTIATPVKDILGLSKQELINQICFAMGGRIGEEVETGDFSNGAAMDIKQATKIARHMVCDWGMSDLGPIAYGENQDQVFLAREITRNQNYSEETAKRIDAAIAEIINAQFERARELISANKEALEKVAEALLKYETVEAVHVHEIIKYGEIRTPVMAQHNTPPPKQEEQKSKPPKAKETEKEDPDLPGAEPALA
ncbi:MAG: ATP-dependent zinc metalloprotease FtsH [Verrucomicrobiota bacterium JB022]|nr:ATP-dependent zinc metalloprotease FtsH [Verrucomicrobiota bacterium JB022]